MNSIGGCAVVSRAARIYCAGAERIPDHHRKYVSSSLLLTRNIAFG